jgi:hypothetical protein
VIIVETSGTRPRRSTRWPELNGRACAESDDVHPAAVKTTIRRHKFSRLTGGRGAAAKPKKITERPPWMLEPGGYPFPLFEFPPKKVSGAYSSGRAPGGVATPLGHSADSATVAFPLVKICTIIKIIISGRLHRRSQQKWPRKQRNNWGVSPSFALVCGPRTSHVTRTTRPTHRLLSQSNDTFDLTLKPLFRGLIEWRPGRQASAGIEEDFY